MIHWFTRAPGPHVVLLHGFAGTVYSWESVVKNLPKSAAVVAIALPGHHSQAPPQRSFVATRDALLAELQSLGPNPVHLVGYSLGARLALAMSLHMPERFTHVTLVSGHTGLIDKEKREEREKSDAQWARLLEDSGIDAFANQWSAQPLFASQQNLSNAEREAQDRARRAHDPYALAASLRSTGLATMPDYGRDLAKCRLPMTFVAGESDKKFCAIATAAHEQTPLSRLAIIPLCGHNPLIEAPIRLAEIIRTP